LTVTEVYEFLRYFDAPESILTKKPSGGLFDGQTDESEMGVSYAAIDALILNGEAGEAERRIIERYHAASAHKRSGPILYGQ
ncbi:MAG: NAD(+) synthase, partial [Clostridia bacterium]|nr:NAD(+) synthase [Clostridia bacterium]